MIANLEYSLIGTMNRGLDNNVICTEAVRAFNLAYGRGKLAGFIARILGRDNRLESLASQPVDTKRSPNHIVSIPIKQIKGSLGRSADFDAHFNPLHERNRSRWVSVAMAFKMNIPLPPVELVKVDEAYYVRDGHHRISVARVMDQETIDARIVD